MRFSGGGTLAFLDAATTTRVSAPTTSFTVACNQPLAILQSFELLHCSAEGRSHFKHALLAEAKIQSFLHY